MSGWTIRIFACAALALPPACEPAPLPPLGSYSDVAVIVPGGGEGEWGTALRGALAREQDYFVSREALFQVSVFDAEGGREAPRVKNIVVCGVVDPDTPQGRRIVDAIGEENAARVRRGEINLVRRDDYPGSGQLTVVVTAASAGALGEYLRSHAATVTDVVESSCRERLRENLRGDRNERLAENWARTSGFRIDVPSVYFPAAGGDASGGVELQREGPPRVLGVFWRDGAQAPSLAHADDLFGARAEYVFRRYDGDRMDRSRTRFDETRLGDYAALRMSGYWFNDRHSPAGGFYETYFVWDQERRRLWAVDLVVYAPGREKTPLLRELRALAETFRVL
jgi:hypothetical protein